MSCCNPVRRCRLACVRGAGNRASRGIAASCSPQRCPSDPARLRAPPCARITRSGADDQIDRNVIRTALGFGARLVTRAARLA
jgi:hypothetical protein